MIHEVGRVTIPHMPRAIRRTPDTPEARALDEIRRAFDRTEAQLERLREQLKAAVIAAVVEGDPPMSKAEAARRAGYSREYVSRLVADASERRTRGSGDVDPADS